MVPQKQNMSRSIHADHWLHSSDYIMWLHHVITSCDYIMSIMLVDDRKQQALRRTRSAGKNCDRSRSRNPSNCRERRASRCLCLCDHPCHYHALAQESPPALRPLVSSDRGAFFLRHIELPHLLWIVHDRPDLVRWICASVDVPGLCRELQITSMSNNKHRHGDKEAETTIETRRTEELAWFQKVWCSKRATGILAAWFSQNRKVSKAQRLVFLNARYQKLQWHIEK